MAASHVAFVHRVAGRTARATGHPADELVAAGLLGLSIGITKLVPGPTKPLTYLGWWVSKYVSEAASRLTRSRSELGATHDLGDVDRPGSSADEPCFAADLLGDLDPVDAQILALSYCADQTVPTVAAALGLPAAVVYRRRTASLAHLRSVA